MYKLRVFTGVNVIYLKKKSRKAKTKINERVTYFTHRIRRYNKIGYFRNFYATAR